VRGDEVLLRRRAPKGLLGGMLEVPSSSWCEGEIDKAAAKAEAEEAAKQAQAAAEALAASAGIDIAHVPYKSATPAVTDLVGGHVQMMIVSLPSVWPQVKAGRLRALALSTAKRSSFAPEMPIIADTVPGAQFVDLPGVSHFAPAQRPAVFNRAVLAFLERLPAV
jgi:tripartite-type tricarboxylate transporter receptor subunit TctC